MVVRLNQYVRINIHFLIYIGYMLGLSDRTNVLELNI